MKTLVVLTALMAVAVAGPTFRGDTDFDATKEKRSPTFGSLAVPSHLHQPYVQPIIPHHLGLKKPLIVHQPYGHHIYRSEEEQMETHSAEVKESKKTCMKEMAAKCDGDIIAKSSELNSDTKIEDIDGNISDTDLEQSLHLAREAVDTLQKKLQLAENNPGMTKWHHGPSKAEGSMHENVETAKLALEHMERSFDNLESMNVHARTFTNTGVHDANLKLESARTSDADNHESTESAALKSIAAKSDEERVAQWKDAIENIQKNVELVRNIEDSFQHKEFSEKSAAFKKSSSLKDEISNDHKQNVKEGHISDMHTSEMKMADTDKHESTETTAMKTTATFIKDEEKLAQWKDAIENIQKNVELVRNIEDSFQHQELSEKSSALETSSSLKQQISNEHKQDAVVLKEEKTSDMRDSEMKMAQGMEMADGKSSWQAREHEKFMDSKNEMETSASTKSESKTTLHSANKQNTFRSTSSLLEKSSDAASRSDPKFLAENVRQVGNSNTISKPKELASQPTLKSSQNMEMKQAGDELFTPIADTTTMMKSAEHYHNEQQNETEQHSSYGHTHQEHDMSSQSQLHEHKMSAEHHQAEHSSHMEHDMNAHHDHQKSTSIASQLKEALDKSMSLELAKPKETEHLHHESSISATDGKEAHAWAMKSSDQFTGQSQPVGVAFNPVELGAAGLHAEKLQHSISHSSHGKSSDLLTDQSQPVAVTVKPVEFGVSGLHADKVQQSLSHGSPGKSTDQLSGPSQAAGVAVKPVQLGASGLHSEKLHDTLSHGTHSKSAEDGALFAPMEMNSGFKEALVPSKAWKAAHGSSRGAYGAGAALSGLGGSYGSSYGTAGSGAVGVFPSARVGGCAIPLLLSCSPKVVAGQLAKSHSYAAPSYAAPAYRSSESLNFHSKRDITKISRPSNIQLTPTNKGINQKNIMITEKL